MTSFDIFQPASGRAEASESVATMKCSRLSHRLCARTLASLINACTPKSKARQEAKRHDGTECQEHEKAGTRSTQPNSVRRGTCLSPEAQVVRIHGSVGAGHVSALGPAAT